MINTFKTSLRQQLQEGGNETTIYLNDITTVTGESVAMTDFLPFTRGIITVDPENDATSSSRPEFISFTGIDTNAKTLTGCVRGLSAKSNSVVTGNKTFHPVDSPVIISFGHHNIQDFIDYIDNEIGALTVGTSAITTAAIAGETIASSDLVYLKESDGRWWKVDADTEATVYGVKLGIAQGAGTAGNAITNGIVTRGRCTNFTGLTANTRYYASNTLGGISTSAGTISRVIGYSLSTTVLEFDPDYEAVDPNSSPRFVKESTGIVSAGKGATTNEEGIISQTLIFNKFGDGSDGDKIVSSPETLTRDMYYNNLTVNSTLTTNGFKIYVKDTLDGNGTIQYPTPSNGSNASGSNGGSGGNGFSGTSYGVLLNVPGSGGGYGLTYQGNAGGSIGAAGTGGIGSPSAGNGGNGGNGSNRLIGSANNPGGDGHEGWSTSSGNNASGGGGGGGGASGGIIMIFARNWAGTFTIRSVGGNGGTGGPGPYAGTGDGPYGGSGGSGGSDVSISKFGNNLNWDIDFLHFNQNGTISVRYPAGAGGGGGGGGALQSTRYGGGGGGAGGAGGISIIFYVTKTWTGSYVLTGGTGGVSTGTGGTGGNGITGIYYEKYIGDLI